LKANEAMMIQADAVIANLTPFRGPGADAGTVYELGFMAGGGKLCLAYCNDSHALRRSRAQNSPQWTSKQDTWSMPRD